MLSDYAAGDAQWVWEASVKEQYNILVTPKTTNPNFLDSMARS